MMENIVAKAFGYGYAYSVRMSRMCKKLKEAGGVAFEILQNSGLLEFQKQRQLWKEMEDRLREYDVDGVHYGVALEVYVRRKEKDALDHIYICAADLGRYQLLLEFGDVEAGKLILEEIWLQKIAKKDFCCILPLSEKEPEIEEEFYEAIFGERIMYVQVTPWRTQQIAKNGFNLVLFYPISMTERIEARVDLYALETAMRVLEQEEQIREFIDPQFYVERMEFGPWDDNGIPFPFWDDEVLDLMKGETEGIFLREAGLKVEDFPLCYRKLAYQTAFIKHYYPQLETVVKEVREEWDNHSESLGIELDFDVSRGAYCCSEKEIRMIARQRDKVDYPGCQSSYNAGLIVSEMGLTLKRIKERAEIFAGEIEHISICLPTQLISRESMEKSIERFRRKAAKDEMEKLSLQIYEELELKDCGTVDLANRASELAGLTSVSFVPRALSIVAAYEHMDSNYVLEGWENGLVLDWSDYYLSVSVVSRLGGTEVDILNQRVTRLPMGSMDKKTDLNHDFLEELHSSMYAELNKDGMLAYFEQKTDKPKVWEAFYASSNRVLKQIRRCGYAYLMFDENGEYEKTERYAGGVFVDIFHPYWKKAEVEIKKVLEGISFSMENISKIYLAGEWGNYPYLWQCLRMLFSCSTTLCLMADTTYAAVTGVAYLAKDELDAKEKEEE